MYQYRAEVLRVVDGDTVDVDIDLGFGIWLRNERVRLLGIDTPESRTSDKVEKVFGLASKARLKELLNVKEVTLLTYKDNSTGEDAKGKFGRILGDFKIGDKTATQMMIEEGHAVPYQGENKDLVQEQHMKNRERLIAEGKVKL